MAPGIFNGDIAGLPDFFLLDGAMEPLQFAIALRMVQGGPDMGKPAQADELFEILTDKLRAVITDNPGGNARKLFHRSHPSDDIVIKHHIGQTAIAFV